MSRVNFFQEDLIGQTVPPNEAEERTPRSSVEGCFFSVRNPKKFEIMLSSELLWRCNPILSFSRPARPYGVEGYLYFWKKETLRCLENSMFVSADGTFQLMGRKNPKIPQSDFQKDILKTNIFKAIQRKGQIYRAVGLKKGEEKAWFNIETVFKNYKLIDELFDPKAEIQPLLQIPKTISWESETHMNIEMSPLMYMDESISNFILEDLDSSRENVNGGEDIIYSNEFFENLNKSDNAKLNFLDNLANKLEHNNNQVLEEEEIQESINQPQGSCLFSNRSVVYPQIHVFRDSINRESNEIQLDKSESDQKFEDPKNTSNSRKRNFQEFSKNGNGIEDMEESDETRMKISNPLLKKSKQSQGLFSKAWDQGKIFLSSLFSKEQKSNFEANIL